MIFVPQEGLEPTTNGLRGHCSTIELLRHFSKAKIKYDMILLTNYAAVTLTALSPLSSDSTSNSTA